MRTSLAVPVMVVVGISIAAGAWTKSGAPAAQASWQGLVERSRDQAARRVRLVPAPEGNEVRYRVREQLAGIDFPSDAVGRTGSITGALVLETDGTIVREESKFVVDLRTLRSDAQMRDNYIQRNSLETEQFPMAEFVPTAFTNLPDSIPTRGQHGLRLVGDFTAHGVTKSITWTVIVHASPTSYKGMARTAFTFADFGMPIPRVARVLGVQDTIRLEYDFHLVPEPTGGF